MLLNELVNFLFPPGTWGPVSAYLDPITLADYKQAQAAAGLTAINPWDMPLDQFVQALRDAQEPFLGTPSRAFLASLTNEQAALPTFYNSIGLALGLPIDAANRFSMPGDGWKSAYELELESPTTTTTIPDVTPATVIYSARPATAPVTVQAQEVSPMFIYNPNSANTVGLSLVNQDDFLTVYTVAMPVANAVAFGDRVLRSDGTFAQVSIRPNSFPGDTSAVTIDGRPLSQVLAMAKTPGTIYYLPPYTMTPAAPTTAIIPSGITPVTPVTVSLDDDQPMTYTIVSATGAITPNVSDPQQIVNAIVSGADVYDATGTTLLQPQQSGSDPFNPANWIIDGNRLAVDQAPAVVTAAPYTGQGTPIPPTRVVIDGRGRIVTTMEELQSALAAKGSIDTNFSAAIVPILEGQSNSELLTAGAIGAGILGLVYMLKKKKK